MAACITSSWGQPAPARLLLRAGSFMKRIAWAIAGVNGGDTRACTYGRGTTFV
jgi:hypothetical protein